MNNNISPEIKKEINKIITNCALMVVKKSDSRSNSTVGNIAENNIEYVEEYMTLEQFKMYIQAKVNIILADIF